MRYCTIIYNENGNIFGTALFINNVYHYPSSYAKKLYVAPPSVLF